LSKKKKEAKAAAKSTKAAKAYYTGMGFEGAQMRRRLSNWQPTRASMTQLVSADGEQLRARSRDLLRNNPYVASAAESFVANLVGAGIKPSPLLDDAELKDALQVLWREWTDQADFTGQTDFYGLQALVARALFEAGECFIRFRSGSNNTPGVPLQLQLLESEMLAYNKNHMADDGNQIINGIELDGNDRRIAYWFYSVYPGDPYYRVHPLTYVRVPADEVLHIYRPLRPGQMRGVPWITPSIVKLFLVDQYDDAELERKKLAAMYAGFVTSAAPGDMFDADDPDDLMPNGEPGPFPVLEPGTIQSLLPGEDIKFSDPAEAGNSYEPFQYRNLLAASTGMGVPYMSTTGDNAKANYSSSRQSLVEFRNRLTQLQHSCMVFQMCRPVWARWLTDAVLSGEIDIADFLEKRRKYLKVKWIPPRFDWIDPLKDGQAEKLLVDNGYKARSDVIEELGYDPEETDRRIAADQKRVRDLGILLTDSPLGQSLSKTPPADDSDPDAAESKQEQLEGQATR
jgi:lambda family phage portal protein